MAFKKTMEIISLGIFYVFLVWLVFQIIMKMTGHSPDTETILATAITMIISFLLIATLKVGEFIGKTNSFMENAKESFRRMREDMNKIKDDIDKTKR